MSAARICPPLSSRTQPGRLDDRIAEVVAVLLGCLTGAQADANTERLTVRTIVMFDSLLHSHPPANARLGEENITMSPSPRFFTSVPPDSATAPRNSRK